MSLQPEKRTERNLLMAKPRKVKRQEIKQALIVDAAKRLFSDLGYEKTTLESIGEAVGLTKQTLYYYFPSKNDLLMEVCLASPDVRPVDTLRMGKAQGKSRQHLIARYIVDSIFVALDEFSGRLLVQHLPFMKEESKMRLFQGLREELDELEEIIEEGCRCGEFSAENPRTAAHIIQGSVHSLAYHNLHDRRLAAEKICNSYVKILLGGLCSPVSFPTEQNEALQTHIRAKVNEL